MNTFNENRRDETDGLSVMLNELPQVDPPPTLVGTVMSTITQFAKTHANHPPAHYMRRGNTMAKKVLWSVAAAAAAALVVMRVAGYPPVEKGTEATIGAAQRYQAPQVAAADVKLEDQELQAFLQSDLFRQLVADKAAVEALKNNDFQKAMANDAVRAALARSEVQKAIAYVRIDAAALEARKVANLDAAKVARVVNLDVARLDAAKLDAAKLDAAKLEAARVALEGAIQASPSLAYALAAPQVANAIAASSLATVLAAPRAALFLSQQAAMNAVMLAAPNAASNAAPAAAPAGDAARD